VEGFEVIVSLGSVFVLIVEKGGEIEGKKEGDRMFNEIPKGSGKMRINSEKTSIWNDIGGQKAVWKDFQGKKPGGPS